MIPAADHIAISRFQPIRLTFIRRLRHLHVFLRASILHRNTGAVFLLNLAVPTPGDHVLIVLAQDSAFLFRNNNITKNPYPVGIPGVFTITGNSAINTSDCTDTGFYQSYYYFFYDTRITLNKCPSPRIAITAKTPAPATITRIGITLSSNYASGNQWYFNDKPIVGATNQTDTLGAPGPYKVVCKRQHGLYPYF
ncbi:MAG: hypothetical protein WDM78_13160 [Puia sp.]